MKILLIIITFLLCSCASQYRPVSAYETCKTYDHIRTKKEWKYLWSNKEKSPRSRKIIELQLKRKFKK